MSVENNFNKLKNQIGIKRCLIIEGNVNDIYEDNGMYVSLKTKLTKILSKRGYDYVYTWDRIDGLIGDDISKIVSDNNKLDNVGSAYDFNNEISQQAKSDEDTPVFTTVAEFFSIVRKNMLDIQNSHKVVFLADFSDYLFTNEQGLSEQERNDLMLISKALREKEYNPSEITTFDTSLIFITNNIGKIPTSFYLNNPDVSTITLTKPNRDERAKFIKENKMAFKILNDLDDLFLQDIYDTTEGWSLKEIYQLIKYSRNIDESLVFDKLLNLYQYGEKISPWEEMNHDKLSTIADELKKRVIGQDHAVDKVKKVVYKAFTGLSGVQYSEKRTKPKGTLFFVGPTGVGKTELAKALAKFLFGDEKNCIRFDMSEYNQEASDQKLIGAPPGYVGYEEGGQLTNAVKEKPFSVLLFDEIEKAHPRILDKFLQILEDGRLTDNKGQTVSFSDTFIIFTSNIGVSEIDDSLPPNQVHKEFIKKVSEHFRVVLNRPELLGRIGNNIVPFNFIKDANFKASIIKQKLKPIINLVYEKYKLNLKFNNLDNIIRIIVNSSDDKKGGRDLLNSIEQHIIDGLSEFIFENKLEFRPNQTILADLSDNNTIIYKLI